MKPLLSLPINIDDLLHGKAVESERLEFTAQVTAQVAKLAGVVTRERSRGELMHSLDLNDRMHFSNEYLQPAIAVGLIDMAVPDKPTSRFQKVRLTEKGRAWLAQQRKRGGAA